MAIIGMGPLPDSASRWRTGARQGETAINGETETACRRPLPQAGRRRFQMRAQFGNALAVDRSHRKNRRIGKRRTGQQISDFGFGLSLPVDRYLIDFCQRFSIVWMN